MRKRTFIAFVVAASWASPALADEPRFHATAGAAHAVGGTQEQEFGAGGGGSATVELAVGNVLGFQGSAGAVVLAAGAPPSDPTVARHGTGAAFLGMVGVRFRPLGASRAAGPWIDANGGLAQTGSEGRVAIDAHLGWDFRLSQKTRWDLGPFIGMTQIMQSELSFRPDDARIAWAGLQLSIGASERRPVATPARDATPEPVVRDSDGSAEAFDVCPIDDDGNTREGCPPHDVQLVGDRIVIDDVIHFEFNSPRIRSRSFGLVRKVARFIVENPDILDVSIEGHADARGTEAYNLRLSEARAASTCAMLVRFGVDESRLHAVGYGKSKPLVSTPLPEQRNRRVEFIVVRSREAAGPPAAAASNKQGGS